MLDFLSMQTTAANPTFISMAYTVILGLVLSIAIGVTYEKTFRGLSYSRNFIQALILGSVVAATVMQAIGDSLARGLGMIGALAIIRFRTNFRDPRDIIFMFAALAVGIACGVNSYSVGIVGTAGFCGAAFLLYYSPFGSYRFFDGLLRFTVAGDSPHKQALEEVLTQYCKVFALVTLREAAQGKRLDYAYHVKLKQGRHSHDFVNAIKKVESVEGVNLMLQETTVEL
jgi:F0F1-type ATP synthase membrane subunit c/vacuolar-type H+-ATPase subunit K